MNKPTINTTLLLLISEPVVRLVLQEILERQGYAVRATGDIGGAVDRLKECIPDLLIIGNYIESIPGHDAAKYLRTKCTGIRVLMVGGLVDDDRLQHRAELHRFEVFPKPYSAAQFLEKVKEVLSH
jgi:DNA-binding NtrC family response regulator